MSEQRPHDEKESVQQALELSRAGDVNGARLALEHCCGAEALGMRFHFAMFLEDHQEARGVCDLALSADSEALIQSTWRLRRARSLLFGTDDNCETLMEVQRIASEDLMKVISLRAVDDHVEQAQRILLSMATFS